jgi:outer membrane biosynthesis protein TonB
MRILNLTPTARMIVLRTQDIILKPFTLSVEFDPTERVVEDIIMTEDYQNKYRIVMDASEKSQYANHPMIPGVIVSAADAQIIEKNLQSKIYPPKLDMYGNEIKPKEEVKNPEPPKVENPEEKKDENPEPPNESSEEKKEDASEETQQPKEKKVPVLNWDKDAKTVEFGKVRLDTLFRTLNNPENLQIVYTSTNTDIAIIDEEGKIEVRKKGKTNIMATSIETDEFKSAQAIYKLTVK